MDVSFSSMHVGFGAQSCRQASRIVDLSEAETCGSSVTKPSGPVVRPISILLYRHSGLKLQADKGRLARKASDMMNEPPLESPFLLDLSSMADHATRCRS